MRFCDEGLGIKPTVLYNNIPFLFATEGGYISYVCLSRLAILILTAIEGIIIIIIIIIFCAQQLIT